MLQCKLFHVQLLEQHKSIKMSACIVKYLIEDQLSPLTPSILLQSFAYSRWLVSLLNYEAKFYFQGIS